MFSRMMVATVMAITLPLLMVNIRDDLCNIYCNGDCNSYDKEDVCCELPDLMLIDKIILTINWFYLQEEEKKIVTNKPVS